MARKQATKPDPIIADRLRTFRREMKKQKIDAYLISNRMDHYYLTGFTGEDSAVLITARDVHLITDGRFATSLQKECPWAKVWMRTKLLNDEIANVCRELGIKTLTVQGEVLTMDDHATLTKLNRSTKIKAGPGIVGDQRILKDAGEMKVINKAIRIAEQAFQAMLEQLTLGMTEQELAARLEYEMGLRGATGPSFPTIVAQGPNAALPHAVPGARKVTKGCSILFDWGARFKFYCSDLTRVIFVGSIPPKIAAIYEIVKEAQRMGIKAIKPGVRMCDVDKIVRDHIAEAGYGEYFGHGLGHGMGLDIHEAPSLSWRSDAKLKEGMVVTVEPGIYLPNIGGVRIEDDILVTARGAKVLSRLSRNAEDWVLPIRK
jgi:Xaa-Pro aminopeptidase